MYFAYINRCGKSLENKVVLSWKIMENHSQISVQTLTVEPLILAAVNFGV